jgi:hypothetical protein
MQYVAALRSCWVAAMLASIPVPTAEKCDEKRTKLLALLGAAKQCSSNMSLGW